MTTIDAVILATVAAWACVLEVSGCPVTDQVVLFFVVFWALFIKSCFRGG